MSVGAAEGYDGEIRINTKVDMKNASSQMLGLENRISKTADKISMLKDRIEETQFALSKGYGNVTGDDLKKYQDQLKYAEQDMRVLIQRQQELKARQDKTAQSVKKIGDNTKASMEKASKSVKKTGGILKTLASRFKGILLSLLIFNWISKGFNTMISGMKEGLQNLAQYSKEYNTAMSSLKSANTQMKNSFATAFAPIIQMVIPYLVKLIGYVTQAMNVIAQFAALIGGKTTYVKAKAVQEDYAAGISKTGSAAKKAAKELKGYLSPIDEINKLSKDTETDESGSGGLTPADMFETVPVDNKLIDKFNKLKEAIKPIIDYVKQLSRLFNQGFKDTWDKLKIVDQLADLKDKATLLKDALKDIFTDPRVVGAVDKWAKAVAYNLGKIAASVVSIGVTIAQNIVGGFAKYFDQNRERVKKFLINCFDITSEIANLYGNYYESLANIFQAFGSETGQQLTANIIGIFADAYMGIYELSLKLYRDITALLFQPIIDNQEKIKTGILGILEVLEKLTGTIKNFVDHTVDKLNEMYDGHIKPLFDSLTKGISDILGKLLDFWNNNVKPVLDDMAARFDTLMSEHIQPMIDQAIIFIGNVADTLKILWENVLQPFITWLIENILPVLVPIFDTIGDLVFDVFNIISDVITGIIKIMNGLLEFLNGVFTGDWEKAWKGIQDIFTGVFDTIKSVFDGVVQFFQDKIDGIKSAFQSLKDLFGSAPSYTASQPSYSKYNSIPGYASGTVIPASMSKHLAWLGDNNRETEVVSPLSTMKQAFLEAMKENNDGNNGTQIINLILDGNVVAQAVVKAGKVIQMSTGSNPFELE